MAGYSEFIQEQAGSPVARVACREMSAMTSPPMRRHETDGGQFRCFQTTTVRVAEARAGDSGSMREGARLTRALPSSARDLRMVDPSSGRPSICLHGRFPDPCQGSKGPIAIGAIQDSPLSGRAAGCAHVHLRARVPAGRRTQSSAWKWRGEQFGKNNRGRKCAHPWPARPAPAPAELGWCRSRPVLPIASKA